MIRVYALIERARKRARRMLSTTIARSGPRKKCARMPNSSVENYAAGSELNRNRPGHSKCAVTLYEKDPDPRRQRLHRPPPDQTDYRNDRLAGLWHGYEHRPRQRMAGESAVPLLRRRHHHQ